MRQIIRHAKTTDELSEDQDAIQSLRVFGWTLDLGTATALAQTFPACTTLSCLRYVSDSSLAERQ